MEKQIKTIGVLTSGGDAPGMNAAVRAVQHGEEVGKSAFSILANKLEGEEKRSNKIVRTNLIIRGTTK